MATIDRLGITSERVTRAQAAGLTRYSYPEIASALAAFDAAESAFQAASAEAAELFWITLPQTGERFNALSQPGCIADELLPLARVLSEAAGEMGTISACATYSRESYPVPQWEKAARKTLRAEKRIRQEVARLTQGLAA